MIIFGSFLYTCVVEPDKAYYQVELTPAGTGDRMARTSKVPGGPARMKQRPPAQRPSRIPPPSRRRRIDISQKEEPEEENRSVRSRFMKEGSNFLFDFMAAVIVLLIIIGSLYTYTGNWPPLVVVQSGSMEHSEESSSIGVIDTGDLVFVKDMGNEPIIPYYEGREKDHRSYSSYGDVIIFRPNGNDERTAIIHRAVLYIEFNSSDYDPGNFTGGSFDIPSMGLTHQSGSIMIEEYEWPAKGDLEIDLNRILDNFANDLRAPHSGYITKGDDNPGIDQTSTFYNNEPWLEPVSKEWVIGKSVGELPWFGIIKLWMEGKEDWHPNSQKNLYIALIVVVLSPFVIDIGIHMISKAVRKKEEDEEEQAEEIEGRDRVHGSRRRRYVDLDRSDRHKRPRRAPQGPMGPDRKR